jgi:hypothetical protein
MGLIYVAAGALTRPVGQSLAGFVDTNPNLARPARHLTGGFRLTLFDLIRHAESA